MSSGRWAGEANRSGFEPLHPLAYEAAVVEPVRVNSQFRIRVDGNRYSVPCQHASGQLTLKRFPDRLLVYAQDKLVAEHVRRYDRNQDYELPDHVQPLLLERKTARDQRLFLRFLALSSQVRRSTTDSWKPDASIPNIMSRRS